MSANTTNDPVARSWNLEGLYELGDNLSMVSEPEGGRVESFKDLWVWKHGMQLVKEVYLATRKMPKEELYGLTSQLRRASVSVPSNIAEGWGRNKTGYLLLGMSYARGSLHEIETQLLICVELEFMSKQEVQPILDHIGAISVGLLRFMNKLETKKR
jgi:four helix bundle protein